jgi:hypothetical protein
MTSKLVRLCLLAFALIGICVTNRAEDLSNAGVRFRTFGWKLPAQELFYDSGGKDVPVEILDATRSRFYKLTGPKTVAFYRIVTDAEGKKTRQTVVTVDVAGAGLWPLLVFVPDKNGGPEAVRVVAIADDLESFPAPQFRFVNFTPVQLGLTLGSERVVLSPGALHALDPGLKSNETPATRYFVVSIATEEGPKMLYANNWVVRSNQRTLVLIFAEDNALQVRRIVEDVNQYAQPAR